MWVDQLRTDLDSFSRKGSSLRVFGAEEEEELERNSEDLVIFNFDWRFYIIPCALP